MRKWSACRPAQAICGVLAHAQVCHRPLLRRSLVAHSVLRKRIQGRREDLGQSLFEINPQAVDVYVQSAVHEAVGASAVGQIPAHHHHVARHQMELDPFVRVVPPYPQVRIVHEREQNHQGHVCDLHGPGIRQLGGSNGH